MTKQSQMNGNGVGISEIFLFLILVCKQKINLLINVGQKFELNWITIVPVVVRRKINRVDASIVVMDWIFTISSLSQNSLLDYGA